MTPQAHTAARMLSVLLVVSSACGCATQLPASAPATSADRFGHKARTSTYEPDRLRVFLRTSLRSEPSGTESVRLEREPETKPDASAGDLSAAAQNPIASNISVPFENTIGLGAGPDDATSWGMNIQPVLPVPMGNVNIITRPIIPLLFTPGLVEGLPVIGGEPVGFGDTFGLGDINVTSFISPAKSKPVIWGIGPSLTLPTATDDLLGSGRWSLGPSLVALTIRKPWLVGVLTRHLWSFAGDSDRAAVNQSLLQPFVNYNFDGGWYLMTAPVFTVDWNAPSSERWVVPVGGGAGRIFKIGRQPVNLNLQAYYNVERPDTAPDWTIRCSLQFIFPKK